MFHLLSALVLTATATFAFSAQAETTLYAKSYYIFHPNSGTVILEKEANAQQGPASLTKMMTLYLTFQALEKGQISLQSELPVSEKAWKMGGSKMFVEVGKTATVESLIQGIAVSSGNDSTIVVAEFLGGTEEGFAELMNDTAKKIGMTNTHFANASGWPAPDQFTTAKDMAILGHALHRDFPNYYPVFAQESFEYSGIKQLNRNGLLKQNVGVDGLKTGHTEEDGYHLVSSAERGDVRLFAAVLGTTSMKEREAETLKGFNYAFRAYKSIWPVKEGQVVVEATPVRYGKAESVSVVAAKGLNLFVKQNEGQVSQEVIVTPELTAPIAAGQEIGELIVRHGAETYSIPALAGEDVAGLNFFQKIWWIICSWFK